MSVCEKCWQDANLRALLLGGSVTDHYRALLEERKDNPCSVFINDEQSSTLNTTTTATALSRDFVTKGEIEL